MRDNNVVQAIEAILFAAGDPVEGLRIQEALDISEEELEAYIAIIEEQYAHEHHGIELRRIGDSFALASKTELNEVLQQFFETIPRSVNLSQAAYETLAVIAYNQPATRAQIENVRGVNSDGALNRLIEKGLVEMSGTLDLPGRPSVFSTTPLFLRLYGISNLEELEPMDMLMYDTVQDFERSYKKTEAMAKEVEQSDSVISENNVMEVLD